MRKEENIISQPERRERRRGLSEFCKTCIDKISPLAPPRTSFPSSLSISFYKLHWKLKQSLLSGAKQQRRNSEAEQILPPVSSPTRKRKHEREGNSEKATRKGKRQKITSAPWTKVASGDWENQ